MLKEAYGVKRLIVRSGRTDLRYGIDKLCVLIRRECGLNPMEKGTLFLFCGRRNDRIKALIFEGDGFVLLTKRLVKGKTFKWPRNGSDALEFTADEYFRLMDGMEVEASKKVTKPMEASITGVDMSDKNETVVNECPIAE